KTAASHLLNPDLSKMAKSPTSCGISCTKIAKVVNEPSRKDTRKAPPSDNPCVKLSMVLANRFKYPLIWKIAQVVEKIPCAMGCIYMFFVAVFDMFECLEGAAVAFRVVVVGRR